MSPSTHRRRVVPVRFRTLGVGAALVVALVSSPVGPSAGSAPNDDGRSLQELQRQRDQVRQQKAEKASSVDALEATDEEVSSALEALSVNVSIHRDRVEEAERAIEQNVADQATAEAAQASRQAELDVITAQMRESAVEAYVATASGGSFAGIAADDVNDLVKKKTLLGVRATQDIDLAERFRSVQEDLELLRAAAQAAADDARNNKVVVEQQLSELSSAVEEQQAFAVQVEQRLDAALSEADSLASLDAALASSITDKQGEIARAIQAQKAEQAAREARNAASRATAVTAQPAPVARAAERTGPVRLSAPPARQAPAPTPTGPPAGGGSTAPPPITGGGEIVSVGGIRVHASIADNVQALLAAASGAGIQLSGGGYRDPAGQIAVRRNNCGSSNYAIYQMPASSCRPPTARPGSSMHERGLAIDFTQGGRTLTRGSSAFAWLKSNAGNFGLRNLPVEPWHWSTNGN